MPCGSSLKDGIRGSGEPRVLIASRYRADGTKCAARYRLRIKHSPSRLYTSEALADTIVGRNRMYLGKEFRCLGSPYDCRGFVAAVTVGETMPVPRCSRRTLRLVCICRFKLRLVTGGRSENDLRRKRYDVAPEQS